LHQRLVDIRGGWILSLVPALIAQATCRSDVARHIPAAVLASDQVLGGALKRRGRSSAQAELQR